MTFLEDIRKSHGNRMAENLKEFIKLNTKLAKQKNRRIFLLRCKHCELSPTFLNFKLNHLDFAGTGLEGQFSNIITRTKNNILNLSLKQTVKTIIYIEKLITQKKEYAQTHLSNEISTKFFYLQNKRYQCLYSKIKLRQQNKINRLLNKNEKNNVTEIPQTWLENISNTHIPNKISSILSLGPNFSVDITNEKNIPTTEYIAAIESAISDKPNEVKDSIRADITNIITNHKTKIKQNNIKTNKLQKTIKKDLYQAKKFIKDNPQIIILRPDKSNKTVIMDTTEYEEKMENLLADTNTYKKINSDPTNIFQKKNNSLIKKLLNEKTINEKDAKNLSIHNAIPPKIYGLPKLHKQNIPLRPIVSCKKSPLYNLSKYLANCLSNITGKNDHFIKDSFEFKKFIDTVKMPENYKLVSLDVTSLYTNIPKGLVQKVIEKKWEKIKEHTSLTKSNFLEALDLTLNTNYFQYKNKFYKQIDGCAMGSPISSVIAQLVMEHLEEEVIKNSKINMLFFKRFVDDCLLAVHNDNVDENLQNFNNFHKKLQFTSEIEKNGTINFLDLTLNRKNDKILTEWYTKPTWSGRYLNAYSNHTKKQKISVIVGLTDRAITLTSPELRPNALKKVKTVLIQNNFKEKDINHTIKKRTYKLYNNLKTNTKKTNENSDKFVPLPYTKELSEKLKSSLRKHNINVCHKTQNKLSSLFTNLKSQTPVMNQSNVVYSIPCMNCPQKYIGMTSQLLKNRINGHKYTKNACTALHKHETEKKHEFNYKETKILCKDDNYAKLQIKEAISIKQERLAVNDRSDTQGISHCYINLLK